MVSGYKYTALITLTVRWIHPRAKNKCHARVIAHRLGLDDRPQWIITSELNSFDLHVDKLSLGIVPVAANQDIDGSLPDAQYVQLFSAIRNIEKG